MSDCVGHHSHAHDCSEMPVSGFTAGRRQFLKIASLGTGVALFGTMVPGGSANASGSIEAVVLSCMDYRLVDKTVEYLDHLDHMKGEYDHIVLAGASLGVVIDKWPAWAQTFWDHIQIAIDLHHVKDVVVIDHRDCGAYKVVYGKDFAKEPAEETAIHTENLRKIAALIKVKFPTIKVELALMALDGKVEKVSAA
ncbi:carbonic anhydrase [uncultured Gammaproteobacteria bacterium]